ncbi:uncharacterized protein LOC121406254 [Lytechinus variegatus]|uniref:uncharacterized protein LOC121406254 n=1 Tax=Lytechinus variegatus TaxID=7654 RepID=UPI001BB1991C|nr:uncharacterized protein LOC121406254 [Lytechinus variegatus]
MEVNSFFFGLDDLMKEGEFRWADGTLLSETGYFQWIPGNPDNNLGSEHCVERNVYHDDWNDRSCSVKQRFVCEKSKVPPLHLMAMTSTPFGSTGNTPSFSCIVSSDNTHDYITYTERAVRPSLTTNGYTLNVPGIEAPQTGGFTQNLPNGATSVGVYECSSTYTITGSSTSADVTILSQYSTYNKYELRIV